MSRKARKGGGRDVLVRITAMGARGDGLAALDDGTPLFVAHALPGEEVRVRTLAKTDAGVRGEVIELLHASPERRAGACPNGARCGGCTLQHWDRAAQSAWKAAQVHAAVRRAGYDPNLVAPLIAPKPAGRRRARFAVQQGRLGFRERRSHAVIAEGPCQTLGPELQAFWSAAQGCALLSVVAEWTVTITPAGAAVEIDAKAPAPPPTALRDAMTLLAPLARLTWNGEVLVTVDPPRVDLGGLAPVLPPGGFLQPSLGGQGALQDLVLAAVPAQASRVADLYCGLGTFAVPLATRGHEVQAFEAFEPAVAALDAAVRRDASNRTRLRAHRRNLDRLPLQERDLSAFDAVVLDPPRAGARAQTHSLSQSSVPLIVAVSCNPTTWARDASALRAGGYGLRAVTPVDQFPQTPHVELVAVFEQERRGA